MKKSIFVIFALLNLIKGDSQIGWVGNMWPPNGNIEQGMGFTIYVQVWKDAVTNFPGQGAGITCQIYFGSVPNFGGSWSNIMTQNMSYNTDIGNNDEYLGILNLSSGLYEYTCRCSDNGGSTWTWQGGSNGQLTVNAPLGVEWKNLTAENYKNHIYLKWTTASETNNEGFDIERSADGSVWKSIGFVKGQGNSSHETEYSWTDTDPLQATSYYRLRQVDFDGKFTYSETRSVSQQEKATFSVRPNPFTSHISLDNLSEARVEVVDLAGRTVFIAASANNNLSIDLEKLTQGMYLLRVTEGSKVFTVPVFRQ